MSELTCSIEARFLSALDAASTDAARQSAMGAYDRHIERCESALCMNLCDQRDEHRAEIAAERRMDEVMSGFSRFSWEDYLEDVREREMAAAFGTDYRA